VSDFPPETVEKAAQGLIDCEAVIGVCRDAMDPDEIRQGWQDAARAALEAADVVPASLYREKEAEAYERGRQHGKLHAPEAMRAELDSLRSAYRELAERLYDEFGSELLPTHRDVGWKYLDAYDRERFVRAARAVLGP
jgi:hypothetical protein